MRTTKILVTILVFAGSWAVIPYPPALAETSGFESDSLRISQRDGGVNVTGMGRVRGGAVGGAGGGPVGGVVKAGPVFEWLTLPACGGNNPNFHQDLYRFGVGCDTSAQDCVGAEPGAAPASDVVGKYQWRREVGTDTWVQMPGVVCEGTTQGQVPVITPDLIIQEIKGLTFARPTVVMEAFKGNETLVNFDTVFQIGFEEGLGDGEETTVTVLGQKILIQIHVNEYTVDWGNGQPQPEQPYKNREIVHQFQTPHYPTPTQVKLTAQYTAKYRATTNQSWQTLPFTTPRQATPTTTYVLEAHNRLYANDRPMTPPPPPR
ncbi:MAG: hypothetical protein ACRCTR_02315 [Actinomycetota bacterium]